jgi:hypothetical protein
MITGFFTGLILALLLTSTPANAQEKLTLDIGMAAGTRATRTYTEYHLGASAYFSENFAWRNGLFVHAQSESKTSYGFDSSARWLLPFRQGDSGFAGFAIFAGPGLRLPFEGQFAPTIEGGIWFKEGALTFGGGAKSILNTLVRSNQEDDIQFLIFLGLGPTL